LGAPPAETWDIEYLTRSYTERQQAERNIHYLGPNDWRWGADDPCRTASERVPPGSAFFCLGSQSGI
jgi:hypothetical protein